MKRFNLFFLFFFIEVFADNSCTDIKTCSGCISYARNKCAWCSEPNESKSRCQSESFVKDNPKWCNSSIFNPEINSKWIISDTSSPAEKKTVQFTPQQISAKLRPGAQVDFEMGYQPALDLPIDVYYLIDYSSSMGSHVTKIKLKANSVYNALIKFTNNVRFGIGSFVDKPDFPFVSPKDHIAYAYKNDLSLTLNLTTFQDIIKRIPKGSNYDMPEAGLDALMQVMKCERDLGWRPDACRIILVISDSTYHSAGDGRAVGAIKPNDRTCHLNNSYYDYSLSQDYPSLSQLNKIATEGNFKIIFITISKVKKDYEALTKQILGAQFEILERQGQIVKLIKDTYLQSRRYFEIKYQWPSYVQLTLNPDCTINDKCEIEHRKKIMIKASLKVNSCPKSTDNNELTIRAVTGGLEDKMKIQLDVDCLCDCEKPERGEQNSTMCHGFGTYQCGVCKCNKGRSGDDCQCDDAISGKTNLEKCKSQNGTSFCSRRGDCVCGKCKCYKGFSGNFCEFDDSSCQRRDKKLCSGHGRCTLGACECEPGWTGDDCSCTGYANTCYAPYSKEICFGNGDCICGECVCRKLEGKNEVYSGVFCENCEECAQKRCKELEDYVDCNYFKNKTICDQLEKFINQASNTEVLMLNSSEINAADWTAANWCRRTLKSEKSIIFVHFYDKISKKLQLFIQKELEDVKKPDIWVTVGIAVGTVILIGILTVIAWKVLVDIMDQREYEKFKGEAKAAGFVVERNPIYQPATANFANPAYDPKKDQSD